MRTTGSLGALLICSFGVVAALAAAFNLLSDVPPPTQVPEPSTLLLVGSGLVALAARRGRKTYRSSPSRYRKA